MFNKKLLICTIISTILLMGCGSSASSGALSADKEFATMDSVNSEYAVSEESINFGSTAEVPTSSNKQEQNAISRKLIRTFDISIETKNFDDVVSNIQNKTKELNGYVERSSVDAGSYYNSNYNRYSNMTIRIPSNKLDEFVNDIKENSNVTNISESTEDITLQYVDVESRKIALDTEQERLIQLLEKAETVEDIITIESRLSEVRYKLESYTSQLRTMDNQVDYSTIEISVSEVEREEKVEPKTFFGEISERFSDNLYELMQGIRSAIIGIIGSLPFIVFYGIIIFAFVVFIRKLDKKRVNKKKNKENKEDN